MAVEIPASLKPVGDYVIQVVVGAFLFSVVLIAAAGIGGLVHLIAWLGFRPPWFERSSDFGEMLLFGVDCFTFALFLMSETLKFIRSIYLEWKVI